MKALKLVEFGRLVLEDVDPPQPTADEVLVRVEAVGICGTDIELVHGRHGAYTGGTGMLPIVPGHEWSGTILAGADEASGLAEGALVTGETGIGCLRCEYCLTGRHNLCPRVVETGIFGRDGAMRQFHTHPRQFTHLAHHLTPEQAALVEPASVAVHACRRGRLSIGDVVAVLGCGPIGLLAIQAARAFGASYVVATSRSEPKLQLARQLGADVTINVSKRAVTASAAVEGGSRDGFDVVLECSGSLEAVGQALDIVRPGGRVVLVGAYGPGPTPGGIAPIVGKELDVVGVRGSPHAYRETIHLIGKGEIAVHPVVSHRFPLTRYQDAFEIAERGGPEVLKVLLLPQED